MRQVRSIELCSLNKAISPGMNVEDSVLSGTVRFLYLKNSADVHLLYLLGSVVNTAGA
jgi:hypothetical protein